MAADSPKTGIALAFVCLLILGMLPIIASSRPAGFGALGFAFFLSVWQAAAALPVCLLERATGEKGILAAGPAAGLKTRAIMIILGTGIIFGLSTYVYVLAVEKAGPVSTAIAIQAYPLFAILWETLFLKRDKSPLELCFTALLLMAMTFLATGGTWQIAGFSPWFLVALAIPFLWSIAHVIIKEVLDRTPITPAQVTAVRVVISALFLGGLLVATAGPQAIAASATRLDYQIVAAAMGLVDYIELLVWFYAVRSIAVSLAGSITLACPDHGPGRPCPERTGCDLSGRGLHGDRRQSLWPDPRRTSQGPVPQHTVKGRRTDLVIIDGPAREAATAGS